jgi:hypothetical protein
MADLKISQLSDGGASQAADEYVIARSGSNFRIDGASVAAAATSVGTLTSLTVSGDLTVDTNTLSVDSTNNIVRIGTTTNYSNARLIANISSNAAVASVIPTLRLSNNGAAYVTKLMFSDNTNGDAYITHVAGSAFDATTRYLGFGVDAYNQMVLNASGNLGIGVTPSAWGSGYKVIQNLGTSWFATTSRDANFGTNVFVNTSGNYAYIASAAASLYTQYLGSHTWSTAASGTAGNTITFTDAMKLDASGNLGVGTTSPGQRLVVQNTSAAPYISIIAGASSAMGLLMGTTGNTVDGQIVYSNSTQAMTFVTASTERARITSGGYFFINGTSGNGVLSVRGPGTTTGYSLEAANSTGATRFLVSDNGLIQFYKSDNAESARITSGGAFCINTDATAQNGLLAIKATSGGTKFIAGPLTSSADNFFVINANGDGVYLASGATSWTANSDERTKNIIEPIVDASNKVATLRAVIGRYKTDAENIRRSFLIAQDVQAVLPEAINVQDDEAHTLGLQYTDVIPLLVAAIKEQREQIIALEARLEALEA